MIDKGHPKQKNQGVLVEGKELKFNIFVKSALDIRSDLEQNFDNLIVEL